MQSPSWSDSPGCSRLSLNLCFVGKGLVLILVCLGGFS